MGASENAQGYENKSLFFEKGGNCGYSPELPADKGAYSLLKQPIDATESPSSTLITATP